MTGSDLIVLAPWIVFGAGLATVILRLRWSQSGRARASTRPSLPRHGDCTSAELPDYSQAPGEGWPHSASGQEPGRRD